MTFLSRLRGAAICLATALFPFSSAAAAREQDPCNEIYVSDDLDLIVKTQTLKIPRIDDVIGRLDIRPGMTILDIGAGSGQQSYKMAEALKGTGHVYATDINPQLVDYVAAQAKRRRLNNLSAHRVSPEGVDPFYSERTYDLILLYDVYNYLNDRVDYYRKLRRLLNPQGRVVLVESEMVADRSFFREDFKDWDGFIARLRQEPLETPFGRHIRMPLRKLLNDNPRADDRASQRAVLFHLNRSLNAKFYLLFSDGLDFKKNVAFMPEERSYALWLLHRLTLDGLPQRELIRAAYQDFKLMQMLNKLLIIQRYRTYLAGGDVHPYWSRSPEVRWYRASDRRIVEMASAGYALNSMTPLVPFQAVWIFVVNSAKD